MKKRTRSVAIAALFLLGTFGLVTEAQGNKKITFLSVVQEDLGISAVITSVTKDYQKTGVVDQVRIGSCPLQSRSPALTAKATPSSSTDS